MEYDAECGGLDRAIARSVLTPGALSFLAELVHEFRDGVAQVGYHDKRSLRYVMWCGTCVQSGCGLIDASSNALSLAVPFSSYVHTQLYKRRGEVQAQVEAGTYTFDFLPETARIRQVCNATGRSISPIHPA